MLLVYLNRAHRAAAAAIVGGSGSASASTSSASSSPSIRLLLRARRGADRPRLRRALPITGARAPARLTRSVVANALASLGGAPRLRRARAAPRPCPLDRPPGDPLWPRSATLACGRRAAPEPRGRGAGAPAAPARRPRFTRSSPRHRLGALARASLASSSSSRRRPRRRAARAAVRRVGQRRRLADRRRRARVGASWRSASVPAPAATAARPPGASARCSSRLDPQLRVHDVAVAPSGRHRLLLPVSTNLMQTGAVEHDRASVAPAPA